MDLAMDRKDMRLWIICLPVLFANNTNRQRQIVPGRLRFLDRPSTIHVADATERRFL